MQPFTKAVCNVKLLIGNWLILSALGFGALESHSWPQEAAIPGGIVTIPVGSTTQPRPKVTFKNQPIAVVSRNDQWYAVVGLSLGLAAGEHTLQVNSQPVSFEVDSKKYPEQHIKLKTRKHIDLSAEDLKRHRGEKKRSVAAFQHFQSDQEPDLAFILPVDGPFSSPFGLKRFYNGEPRKPHSGLDIAAPTGTKIVAPAAGRVVLTGDFFFNGNVVYLDHGQGVITMYCHLSEISVGEGQWLEKGQRLGAVGATGRATGPHLHWSVSLNDSRVDPMLLLQANSENPSKP